MEGKWIKKIDSNNGFDRENKTYEFKFIDNYKVEINIIKK